MIGVFYLVGGLMVGMVVGIALMYRSPPVAIQADQRPARRAPSVLPGSVAGHAGTGWPAANPAEPADEDPAVTQAYAALGRALVAHRIGVAGVPAAPPRSRQPARI